MPKISFLKTRPPLEVESGTNLMDALKAANVPVASSCGGDGVCVKCKLRVVQGAENLSPENELEQDLKDIHDIPNGWRISCQTCVLGDVTVDATYW